MLSCPSSLTPEHPPQPEHRRRRRRDRHRAADLQRHVVCPVPVPVPVVGGRRRTPARGRRSPPPAGRVLRLHGAVRALHAEQQLLAVDGVGDGLALAERHADPPLAGDLPVVPVVGEATEMAPDRQLLPVRGERRARGPQADRRGTREAIGPRRGQRGRVLVQVAAVLLLADDADATRLRVDDHRLGVARPVVVLHDVLLRLDRPVLQLLRLLRLGRLVDPHVRPGAAEVRSVGSLGSGPSRGERKRSAMLSSKAPSVCFFPFG